MVSRGGRRFRRLWLVAAGVALSGIIGLLALREALRDWSEHGDEELIAIATGLGVCGALTVVLTAKASHDLAGSPGASL